MLFSIPLLVLAAGVLASPRETAKLSDEASSDYGYGYDYGHTFDFLTESSVEPTTYRRHRHTPKNGSPGPPALISAKPTSSSVELVEILGLTTTLKSFSDVSTSEVGTPTFTTTSVVTLTPADVFTSEVSSASQKSTTSIASTSAVSAPELSPITALSSSRPLSSSSTLASITRTISSTPFPSPSESTSATSSGVTSATATATSSKTALSDLGVQPPTTFVSDLDPASPTFKALVLQHHNIHRHNHSAPDLTWDNKLAEYAETTAKTCVWGHDVTPGGGYYGQNIAAGIQSGNITAILSNNFYNEEQPKYPEYGISSPDLTLFEEWGHFSQLVWKATLSVGCYTEICSPPGANALDCKPDNTSYLSGLDCGNGGVPAIFTVCNYDPPGNVAGGYLNVNPPQDDSSVSVNQNGVQGI